ncbi:MAG: hypothetical protein JSW55_00385 [Chloroflexota bacterium]|nr:MAG: hypothetical protein JSW55_00385 [Chloroflexota bacterium]
MIKERRLYALQRQVARLGRQLGRLEEANDRASWLRLVIFAGGVALSGIFFFLGYLWLFGLALLATVVAFGATVAYHRRIGRAMDRFRTMMAIKEWQIARMGLDWQGLPPSDDRPERPLELDFDLVGDTSLMRLVDTAVSAGGSDRLRGRLAEPATEARLIMARQHLVRELVPLSLFRTRLILNARLTFGAEGQWRPDRLLAWLEKRLAAGSLRYWLILLSLLAGLNIIFFLLDLLDLGPPLWQATILLYAFLFLIRSREVGEPFKESSLIRDALEQLMAVFRLLETFPHPGTPQLQDLCRPFLVAEERPTAHLSQVNRIVAATGVRGNPLFWLALNIVVPWDYYFAYRLDQRKEALARHMPAWLNTWSELEAASSLANLAYLNPSYAFPSIFETVDEPDSAVFQAEGLGHPLIPDEQKVCNTFSVPAVGQINIITGSNMSGKSTFLRTVGVNLVLAYAGGPVNAAGLATMPFRLYSCIRVSDSVTDGISYFYAEVKCLKALLLELEAADSQPALYLIDEIFRGTNNRERLQGSRAYIQALVELSGVGLVATHDLELIQLAGEMPAISNYHFTDEVKDGRMVFDYSIRPGPSPTTNALKIMHLEGLPV